MTAEQKRTRVKMLCRLRSYWLAKAAGDAPTHWTRCFPWWNPVDDTTALQRAELCFPIADPQVTSVTGVVVE